MSDSPELAPTSTPQRARASVFLWRGEVRARGHSRPGGAAVRTHRANGMVNPGSPVRRRTRRKAGDAGRGGGEARRTTDGSTTSGERPRRMREDTIKFIEEEHKKNVQKFEAAVDEIKTTAEEVVDGLQSQLEGRKSLKMLREEKVRGPPLRFFPGTHRACPPTAAKPPTRASRAGLRACARPVHPPIQFAHPPFYTVVSSPTRLLLASSLLASTTHRVSRPSPASGRREDAARGCPRARAGEARRVFQRDPGCRGGARRRRRRVSRPPDVTGSAKVYSFMLSSSRGPRAAAQKALREREEAVKRAEVELANSAKERNLINLLFKRKLTPEEEEEQRKLRRSPSGSTSRRDVRRNFRQSARDPPRRRSRRGASTKNSRGVRLRHQDGGVLRPPVRRAHLFRSISRGGVWREKSGVRGDDGDGVRRVVSRSRALSPRPRLRALRHRVQTRGWRRVRAPRAESRAGRSRGGVGIGTRGDDGEGPVARRVAVRRLRERTSPRGSTLRNARASRKNARRRSPPPWRCAPRRVGRRCSPRSRPRPEQPWTERRDRGDGAAGCGCIVLGAGGGGGDGGGVRDTRGARVRGDGGGALGHG